MTPSPDSRPLPSGPPASASTADAPAGETAPSLRSDAVLSVVGAVGGTAISGIASILIARGLGVTGRGRWAVIASLATVAATVAGLGLPYAASYAVARLRAVEQARLIAAAVTGALCLGALGAAGYLVAAAVIHPPAAALVVAAGCALPATTVWYTTAHQLSLTGASVRSFALAQLLTASLTLIVVIVLYALGHLSVLTVITASIAGSLVGAAASLTAVGRARHPGSWALPVRRAASVLRPYIAYAMLTFAILSLTQIVQRVDVLLVAGFRGAHAAGLYAVAAQVTDLMLVVPAALGMVMFRRGAHSSTSHYADALLMLRWTGLFAVAAALAAFALAPVMIPLVFGTGYRASVSPLRLLLPGTIALSLQSVLSQYLAGRGRPKLVLIAWSIGAVVSIAGDLAVIPSYGLTGAAAVSSACYVLVMGLHVRALVDLRRAQPPGAE